MQGGTAMSTGLELAVAELSNQTAGRASYLLLLTDGQTWGDEDTCRSHAATLAQMGVKITALGLGDALPDGRHVDGVTTKRNA